MTLRVAICDDEKQVCSQLETDLRGILAGLNVKHEIDVHSTGEGLCGKMESMAHYDLIFLDIEFAESKINGVEVGRQIRGVYERHAVSIVYISWEKKYSMQLFEIRPLNFLIKPLEYGKVEQVVKTYLKLSGMWVDNFVYKVRQETRRVKVKDIVYLESTNRKITLHLADGRKEAFYGMLKEVYREQLQKFDFLHIHASYAVNYNYVALMARCHVDLTLGKKTLPISKQKKKEVDEAYFAILERRGMV